MTDYAYQRSGRTAGTAVTVAVVWSAMAAGAVWLFVSPVVLALVGLATLPALYDLITARVSGLMVGPDALRWFAGRRAGAIDWGEVDHIRLDTRLDFSVRASAVLHSGRKLRLPLEATPPAEDFTAALEAQGVRVKRHHFSLLG